jgi:hypothetical protein
MRPFHGNHTVISSVVPDIVCHRCVAERKEGAEYDYQEETQIPVVSAYMRSRSGLTDCSFKGGSPDERSNVFRYVC